MAAETEVTERAHIEPNWQRLRELAPFRPMGTALASPEHLAYLAGTFTVGVAKYVVRQI